MSIPEQPFGFVAGRWVVSLADTPMDSDRAPDYKPLFPGSVIFNNKLSHRVVVDGAGGTIGIVKTRYEAQLNVDGKLTDAEGHEFVALPVGVYSVTFSFGQYSWPNFDIEVTPEHTIDSPLWLPSKSPIPAGPGVVHVVTEEVRLAAEAAAASAWEAVDTPGREGPRGPEGPQGKQGIQGLRGPQGLQGPAIDIDTGFPIQIDTTVGTRVLIGGHMVHGDTGWRKVSGLLINGWVGDSIILRRIGPQVTLQNNNSTGIPFSGQGSTSRIFMQAPNGFRPSPINGYFQIGSLYSGDKVANILSESSEGIASSDRETINLRGMVTWITSDSWPSTLPGIPA